MGLLKIFSCIDISGFSFEGNISYHGGRDRFWQGDSYEIEPATTVTGGIAGKIKDKLTGK